MKKLIIGTGAMFLPSLAFAALGPDFNYFISLFKVSYDLLSTYLIPILLLAATGWFFWSIIEYIKAGADEKNVARNKMIKGVVGLAVMVSIWGIVALLGQLVGVNGQSTPPAPCPPGYSWSSVAKRCI
ncbi:MAG: hypothetical protein ACR2IQ_01280 [Minisyncoccia bacterium]